MNFIFFYLKERANFHRSRARQIVPIFNTAILFRLLYSHWPNCAPAPTKQPWNIWAKTTFTTKPSKPITKRQRKNKNPMHISWDVLHWLITFLYWVWPSELSIFFFQQDQLCYYLIIVPLSDYLPLRPGWYGMATCGSIFRVLISLVTCSVITVRIQTTQSKICWQ